MIYLFLTGYTDLLIKAADAAAFFDICRSLGIGPKSQKRDEKSGDIVGRFSQSAAKKLLALAAQRELAVKVVREGGFPMLLTRLLASPASVAGILAAILLFVSAELVLWDVEITGTETLSEGKWRRHLPLPAFRAVAFYRGLIPMPWLFAYVKRMHALHT